MGEWKKTKLQFTAKIRIKAIYAIKVGKFFP